MSRRTGASLWDHHEPSHSTAAVDDLAQGDCGRSRADPAGHLLVAAFGVFRRDRSVDDGSGDLRRRAVGRDLLAYGESSDWPPETQIPGSQANRGNSRSGLSPLSAGPALLDLSSEPIRRGVAQSL